jgi:hypothetical protein
VDLPAGGTSVRFVVTDPLPIVKVRVNDKADAYFFIDTGGPEVVLDPEFASQLGIATQEAGTGTFAGGAHAQVLHATLDSLELGGAHVRHIAVSVVPTRGMELDKRYKIDGIIGTGLLYRFLSTLDYVHGELRLRPRSDSKAFEDAASARAANLQQMWLVGDHFIFARGRLNDGPEQLFSIDTGGAGVGVSSSPATIENSHIVLDNAHAGQGMGGGGAVKIVPFTAKVRFGNLQADNVPGLYTPDGNPYTIFPFDVGGAISHEFFRNYAVTFDFVAMKMLVEKP